MGDMIELMAQARHNISPVWPVDLAHGERPICCVPVDGLDSQ